MGIPPASSFAASQIQPPDMLGQIGKVVQLKNLMQQAQYLPQEEQAKLAESAANTAEAQARTTGQLTANEQAALNLKIQKLTYDAWGDPTLVDEATGKQPDKSAATPSGNAIPYAPGQAPASATGVQFSVKSPVSGISYSPTSTGMGIDPDALLQGLIKRHVPPQIAVGQVAPFMEYAQKHLTMTADQQAQHAKALETIADQLEPIIDEQDPEKQKALVSAFEDHINNSPQTYSGLDPDELNTLKQLPNIPPAAFPLVAGHLGIAKQITDAQLKQAQATTAQISAARDTLGVKAAEAMTPNKVVDFVNNQISPGQPPKGIYAQLASQASTLYNSTLASTGDLKEADKAIAPIVQEANRIRSLPVNAQAEMQARMQEGMALAAPIAKNYTETVSINGTPYTFADQSSLAKAPNAQYVGATLAEQKIPTIPERTAQSIRGLQADLQNLDQVETILEGKQPTSASSRLLVGPANWGKKVLQIDPSLAALPVFQTAGLKTVRDVISSGGEGGMRGVSPEIVKLGDEIYPLPSDTAQTALQKVQNLKKVIGDIVESSLPNVNPAPQRKPIDQLLSPAASAPAKQNRKPLSELIQ